MKRQSSSVVGRRPPPLPSRASRERGASASRLTLRAVGQDRREARDEASGQIQLEIAVNRSSSLWARLPGAEDLAQRAIIASAATCGVALRDEAEVSVQLVDD